MGELGLAAELVLATAAYAAALLATPGGKEWAGEQPSATWLWFTAGMTVLALALLSPLDGAAGRTLSAHMVQHLLLVSVAAPLLVAGRPVQLAAAALRRPPPPAMALGWGIVLAVVHVVTLLGWHVPALYDAALRSDPVHDVEHLTLLVTAFGLWYAVVHLAPAARGGAIIVVFVATLPAMALGVAMVLASTPWYAAYDTSGSHAVADQQLAGVVMWAYGGGLAAAGGVALFASWLRCLDIAAPPTGAATGPGAGVTAAVRSTDGGGRS